MKKKLIIWILGLIIIPVIQTNAQNKAFDETGIYLDTVKAGPMNLRLGVTVGKDDQGNFIGSLNSIDQGSGEISFSEVKIEGKHVILNSAIGLQIEGDFNETYTAIAGVLKQGMGTFQLNLRRVDKLPVNNRPQEPKAPFPYREEEVTFVNEKAGVNLAGTLTLPDGNGPFPAVVLISGSGPQNRNEEILGHKPFLVIADYLTRNGIAVLRYDDRGIAGSTGDFGSATSGDFADDALAGFSYLSGRNEIKPDCIGLIGHSEGGMIAPLVASKSDDIAFIALLAGPGSNLGDNVVYQRLKMAAKMGSSEESLKVQEKCLKGINQIIRKDISAEETKTEVARLYAGLTDEERSLLKMGEERLQATANGMLSSWWKFGLRYDPAQTFSSVKCPILALLGEKDQQVPVALNQKELESITANRNNFNKVIVVPGVNHLFQTCQTGEESEYAQIEETFSPAALEIIKNWINEVRSAKM